MFKPNVKVKNFLYVLNHKVHLIHSDTFFFGFVFVFVGALDLKMGRRAVVMNLLSTFFSRVTFSTFSTFSTFTTVAFSSTRESSDGVASSVTLDSSPSSASGGVAFEVIVARSNGRTAGGTRTKGRNGEKRDRFLLI